MKRRFKHIWFDNYMSKRVNQVDINGTKDILVKYHKHRRIENVMQYINYETLRMSYYTLRYTKDQNDIWMTVEEKSPGIDNMTLEQFGMNLEMNINNMLVELKSGNYKTKVLKRIYIPKKPKVIIEGNKKVYKKSKPRPINLLSINDKILQITVNNQILVPITEEIFTKESFAYRPNLGVKSAIDYIEDIVKNNNIRYALVLDNKNYFDSIPQDKLLSMIRNIYNDKHFVSLIHNIITTGYFYKGKITIPQSGTYQGMPMSAILSNLYLHNVCDSWYKSIKTKYEIFMTRYADDIVIFGSDINDIKLAYKCISKRFKIYDLTISEEKSKIIDLSKENLIYLGFEIKVKDNSIYKYISDDKVNEIKGKIDIIIKDAISDINIPYINKRIYNNGLVNNNILTEYLKDYIRDLNDLLVGIYRYYRNINNPLKLVEFYKYVYDEIIFNWKNIASEEIIKLMISNIKEPKYFEDRIRR